MKLSASIPNGSPPLKSVTTVGVDHADDTKRAAQIVEVLRLAAKEDAKSPS